MPPALAFVLIWNERTTTTFYQKMAALEINGPANEILYLLNILSTIRAWVQHGQNIHCLLTYKMGID